LGKHGIQAIGQSETRFRRTDGTVFDQEPNPESACDLPILVEETTILFHEICGSRS
jgi:hypothetical protein